MIFKVTLMSHIRCLSLGSTFELITAFHLSSRITMDLYNVLHVLPEVILAPNHRTPCHNVPQKFKVPHDHAPSLHPREDWLRVKYISDVESEVRLVTLVMYYQGNVKHCGIQLIPSNILNDPVLVRHFIQVQICWCIE